METDQLIERLATRVLPVQRLRPPWVRMLTWFAISLPYVAAVVVVMSGDVVGQSLVDRRFLIEQSATLLTAVTAAVAAFCSIVPGYDRRILLLPAVPVAIWLGSLGQGCVQDWAQHGVDGLAIHSDWGCLRMAFPIAVVPAVAMALMLSSGAPIYPRTTLLLGTLAVAALGNLALRLFHIGDASMMVLFWHFGSLLLISTLAAGIGRRVFRWRHVSWSARRTVA
jgi:hypothetical protein